MQVDPPQFVMPIDDSRPVLLVIDDSPSHALRVCRIMEAWGWRVIVAASAGDASGRLAASTALVLMNPNITGMSGSDFLAAMRGRGDAVADVPVVALTATDPPVPGDLLAAGFDAHLARTCTPAELVAAAARWSPAAGGPAGGLAATFDAADVRTMLVGFRSLLHEACAEPQAHGAAAAAHRIAGIAGMLGFAELGRRWLVVSEGDVSVRPSALRAARRAIRAIDGVFPDPAAGGVVSAVAKP